MTEQFEPPSAAILPYRAAPPQSDERYLEDLHSAPAAATPFSLAHLPASDIERVKRSQLRRAGVARTDLPSFFEFVFRDETAERRRIKTAAHQRVVFEFIRHFRYCVVRLPTNYSKTYCMAAAGLHELGRDPASRGAFISAAEAAAQRPLGAVRSYVEQSPELRLVFPKLLPSQRDGEPWTQHAITVDRPFGLLHPSVIAVGQDSERLPGARLEWANVDDVLNVENTNTPEQRKKLSTWFKSTVLARFEHATGRCPVTNTPWHPEDLTYALEAIGWPSLNMDVWGGVWFRNADSFDSEALRPCRDAAQQEAETGVPADRCRLAAHDAPSYSLAAVPRTARDEDLTPDSMEPRGSIEWVGDVEELVPLWPERFGAAALVEECKTMGGVGSSEWARTKLIKTQSDEDRRVPEEKIDACLAKARDRGFGLLPHRWDQGNAFTGVDLGFGKGRKSGNCCVFSLAILPDMHRLVLDVDVFKYPGVKGLLAVIKSHHERFQSIVGIESNAGQRMLKDGALEDDVSLRFRSFETNKNKHAPDFGVESIFLELTNTAWVIPAGPRGKLKPAVAHWLDDVRAYQRGSHTGDALMACWIAREQARLLGALKKGKGFWGSIQEQGLGGIMSR